MLFMSSMPGWADCGRPFSASAVRACATCDFSTAIAVPLFWISYLTPLVSSADVILPVCAGSTPASTVVYAGAEAIFIMMMPSRTTPITEPAAISRPFGVMFWRRVRTWAIRYAGSEGLDLGVEHVVVGLDGLGADLGGELHRELRALDG